jgi:hypothetical protein
MMDVSEVPPEFILLNQDGSGFTSIALDSSVDHFLMEGSNSANYMARYEDRLYLFRPSDAMGSAIFNSFFPDDEKGGLMASIYQVNDDTIPELIIYELPDGKIRDRFSLVTCTQNVNTCEEAGPIWEELGGARPRWAPNGRYLAFAAVSGTTSSDLFVYDTQTGNLQRLTQGPDWVGPIEWSPDGTQIIMQEHLNQDIAAYGPIFAVPSSVWSVSVNTNEIRLLYMTNAKYMSQNILQWLNDRRFIAYEGALRDPMLGALNLRVVDMDNGTNRMLFDDWFRAASFDPVHEVLAIWDENGQKCPSGWICLVSVKDGTIRTLENFPNKLSFPHWDESAGLFVSSSDCADDPQSLQAFEYQGNLSCVPKPTPTPEPMEIANYPAPDGKWNISVKDGLWLETESQPTIQLSLETASDIAWCPDSSCFFFSVLQQNQTWTLYHVSLPDLIIEMIDEGVRSTGSYQWLGGEK